MILKASQRGGADQLAAHLMNANDNDHIALEELRGFAANDLTGALEEAYAVSKGTRCKQFLFSLSINPPKEAEVTVDQLRDAAVRAGKAVGLEGQPFGFVVHEKEGRRHAHAVWSRIDADEMKAINLPFFKDRLKALSKELYLENGWELPTGHRENGWANPLNFTLAEWQQAKRLDLDPREVKQVFRDAWQNSDNGPAFRAALEDRGYFVANGDRRAFVALDLHGEVYALSKMTGAKTKELQERLGAPDQFRSVDETRLDIRQRVERHVHQYLVDCRRELRERQRPLLEEQRAMVAAHKAEREKLLRHQEERRIRENQQRQSRIRTGIRGLLDFVIGRAANIRRINEREALEGVLRDRDQREGVYRAQSDERRELQDRIDDMRREQRRTLMGLARIVGSLRARGRAPAPEPEPPKQERTLRPRPRGNDFDFGI